MKDYLPSTAPWWYRILVWLGVKSYLPILYIGNMGWKPQSKQAVDWLEQISKDDKR